MDESPTCRAKAWGFKQVSSMGGASFEGNGGEGDLAIFRGQARMILQQFSGDWPGNFCAIG